MAATKKTKKKAAPASGGNVFTRKLGPVPGYVWVLGAVTAVFVYQRTIGKNKVSTTTAKGTVGSDGTLDYYPQTAVRGGQSGYANNDNSLIESILSILAAGANANTSPSPGNSSGGTSSPGGTGNPGMQQVPSGDSSSQTVVTTTPFTNSIPASVPVPIAAPAQATIVPNPIPGDKSVVVVGKTSDGLGYVYGGTQAQANMLGAQPAAANVAPYAPSAANPVQLAVGEALPQANSQANHYIDPAGFAFTYG